jgi:hypothetical protein
MFTQLELFESPHTVSLEFCLWGWMKGEAYKGNMIPQNELHACVSDAAVRIKEREDQLR